MNKAILFLWNTLAYNEFHDTKLLLSQNFCISQFWQLFRRSKKVLFKNFLNKDCFNILMNYTTYILRLIRWEWLLCYHVFYNKEKSHHFQLMQYSVWRRSECTIFPLDFSLSSDVSLNSITVRVVGVPQMILHPVSSIFPCSPLPSGTWRNPCLSIPWTYLRLMQFSYTEAGNFPDNF